MGIQHNQFNVTPLRNTEKKHKQIEAPIYQKQTRRQRRADREK